MPRRHRDGSRPRNGVRLLSHAGIPDSAVGVLLTVLLAATLAPYLGGITVASLSIPAIPSQVAFWCLVVLPPLAWFVLLAPVFGSTRRALVPPLLAVLMAELLIVGANAWSLSPSHCIAGKWHEHSSPVALTWTFHTNGKALDIERDDAFVSGRFEPSTDGWEGRLKWGTGAVWDRIILRRPDWSCHEIHTNQAWWYEKGER